MTRVTLYTDKSKVGETSRAAVTASHSWESGCGAVIPDTEVAHGFASFIDIPLIMTPNPFILSIPTETENRHALELGGSQGYRLKDVKQKNEEDSTF